MLNWLRFRIDIKLINDNYIKMTCFKITAKNDFKSQSYSVA